MSLRLIGYILISLNILYVSSNNILSVKINDTVTLDPCPVPEVHDVVSHRWVWYRGTERISPNSSPLLHLHENNGSLSVTTSTGDINCVYGCQGFAILSNGTEIPGDFSPYFISPIIPAFLAHNLQNLTLAWGEQFEVPCDAGGVKSSLEIKVNGGILPQKRFRVFNDSVIECRAFNSVGEEKAFAFLTVIPGSKEEARLNLLNNRSSCQPFALTAPSVCSGILEREGGVGGTHAVLTSRLLRADAINAALTAVFRRWDEAALEGGIAALRCLAQAKRLLCLLAFPHCLETEAYVEDSSVLMVDPAERFLTPREFPVCQQHCLLITNLLCASSLNISDNRPPLWKRRPDTSGITLPEGEGWLELVDLSSYELKQVLPELGCAGMPSMTTSTLPDPLRDGLELSLMDLSQATCKPIDFSSLMVPPSNVSQGNCYSGRGVDYRGSGPGPISCLPWSELDYIHRSEVDPLSALGPSILPRESLEPLEPSNQPLCRNPLGLAPKPFCVGTTANGSGALALFDCPLLLHCAPANASDASMGTHASLGNGISKLKRQQYINMVAIVAAMSVFFVLLICLVVGYMLRSCCCCGQRTTWSSSAARERRRTLLVARHARLRVAPSACARFCLRFVFALQDAFCYQHGSGFCPCTKKAAVSPSKVEGKYEDEVMERGPDDEDEEVEACREYLTHDQAPDRSRASVTALSTHTDNQPHLSALDAATTSEAGATTSFGGGASSIFPEDDVQLESAFMLVSAGQLMHPKLKELSYPRKLLKEECILAKSAFGNVILARAPKFPLRERLGLTGNDSSEPLAAPVSESTYVVVKTLNFGVTPAAETTYFREAELLIEFDHPKILKVLGICVPLQPYSLICECMREGDLNSFLHRIRDSAVGPPLASATADHAVDVDEEEPHPDPPGKWEADKTKTPTAAPLPVTTLLRFALDICEAMIYIGSKLYVHRDLATRNCLVSAGGEGAKLADFAMCRRLPLAPLGNGDASAVTVDLVDAESEAPLAVRWLPLESLLAGRFHFDTDVWAFGVLLWELFTFGRLPYGNVDVAEVIKALRENKRLPRPQFCPPSVYHLMRQCWAPIRGRRPTFRQIEVVISTLLQQYRRQE